jgi:hypothetical protein
MINKEKAIYSSAIAASLTVAFVVILTIWAEASAPLKNWLKSVSGHHWTTKSIFSVAFYLLAMKVTYLIPIRDISSKVKTSLHVLAVVTIIGTLTLLLFFTDHYL